MELQYEKTNHILWGKPFDELDGITYEETEFVTRRVILRGTLWSTLNLRGIKINLIDNISEVMENETTIPTH